MALDLPEDGQPEAAGMLVTVGTISGIFGVRGWLRVYSYTDPLENILDYGPWTIGDAEPQTHEVLEGQRHGKGIIARLDGIEDRDEARLLIGAVIRVPRGRFAQTAEDEFYRADLIGLKVRNREGVWLGEVSEVMETGANDVLVLQGERRRLLPFVMHQIVEAVDLEQGIMSVDWDADF